MRVVTIFGTRPEIIRLSRIIPAIDAHATQVLVHTGQNFDPLLSDVFLSELGVRTIDHHLGVRAGSFGEQAGQIIARCDDVLERERPDRVLILGDTNSGLAAIAAARRGVPVFHLEAGNRCYDDRVPEEINRRIIDHSSAVLLPYTHRSKDNLVREGIARERVFVVGNPIREVLDANSARIDKSAILERLGLVPGGFFTATLHRAENVDDPARLARLIEGLGLVADRGRHSVILSLHPRTADRIAKQDLKLPPGVRVIDPLGFADFVHLERHAACVLTDSGTVQEECCIFKVPSVTIRDTTERPETIECGSAILSGAEPADIETAVSIATSSPCDWRPPAEYLESHVSATVLKIVLGHIPSVHR